MIQVFNAPKAAYTGKDAVDVSPGTNDAVGKTFLPDYVSLSAVSEPWVLWLSGKASEVQVESIARVHYDDVRNAGRTDTVARRAAWQALGRFASGEITLVCDCSQHSSGRCLRDIWATAFVHATPGLGVRYVGERTGAKAQATSAQQAQEASRGPRPAARPVQPHPAEPRPTRSPSSSSPSSRGESRNGVPIDAVADAVVGAAVGAAFDAFDGWFRTQKNRARASSTSAPRRPRETNRDPHWFVKELALPRWPCTQEELARCWRAAARTTHPDAGGTAERFTRAQEAHKLALEALEKGARP